jgi:hypothetical protein
MVGIPIVVAVAKPYMVPVPDIVVAATAAAAKIPKSRCTDAILLKKFCYKNCYDPFVFPTRVGNTAEMPFELN